MSDHTPQPGEMLGPYRIEALIGRGGMGEVYRATDTRLRRTVAIKVSAREFSDRFEREARAISAVNHPNICTLYDVGPNFLVMEFVEGDTLSKLIQKGPLPLDKALEYAIQITDALAAAHAKGVIHRDLKPGNIIVTKNGVKVLDFGLAKFSASAPATDGADPKDIATLTEPITGKGSILGTLYYLSPEQAEGRDATERSDIFSFGAVFYEMVSGQRAFQGSSQTSVLAAVLRDQPPPVTQVQPLAPKAIDRVIRKCLAKDPHDRWHSAHDLRPALELIDLDASSPSTAAVTREIAAPARRSWMYAAAAAVGVLGLGGAAWKFWPAPVEPAGHVTRFEVALPPKVFVLPTNFYLRVSPDGRKLAFTTTGAQGGIWIRDLESIESRLLPGTNGAFVPIWSPDSRSIAYGIDTKLMRVELSGGPPQLLSDTGGQVRSGFWSERGEIVFGPGTIRRVPQSGGAATLVTARGKDYRRGHSLPFLLPDGEHFLYRREADLFVGSLSAKPEEQSLTKIIPAPFGVEFVRDGNSDDGNLFFLRDGTLFVQHFDTKALKLSGDATPIASNVDNGPQHGHFSVTAGGVLAYRVRAGTETQLTWVDRRGGTVKPIGGPRNISSLSLAPDESHVAFFRSGSNGPQGGDLWVLDLEREIESPLTFNQSADWFLGLRPVWSRDSKRIAFPSSVLNTKVLAKFADGSGQIDTLLEKGGNVYDWSKDGRDLIVGADLNVTRLDGSGGGQRSKAVPVSEPALVPVLSPDNRWIAYTQGLTSTPEVFIQPYIAPGESPRPGGKYQVSRNGGGGPRWRADGKELFFVTRDGISSVQIEYAGDTIRATVPVKLFDYEPENNGLWDVSRDGQRFLIAKPLPGRTNPPITVVENWRAALKK